MIVTGEASGDLHAANLVQSLKELDPNLAFYGMGGRELEGQGVKLLFDAAKVSVMGIFEVFGVLGDVFRAQKILRGELSTKRPLLLILVDLPGFNLLLARKAKKLGIPVYYYIAPQVWAWHTSRTKTLRKHVDQIGVIWPFEEEFLSRYGLPARYVGHPLLDCVKTSQNVSDFRLALGLDTATRCVGLLPGSRSREISCLLPLFFQSAELLQKKCNEEIVFLLPKASTITHEQLLAAGLSQYQKKLRIIVLEQHRFDLMAACECVVAASGTVTVELAILGIPMVVAYRLNFLSYCLGKILVKLPFFSLPNLIAEKEAVPELLQAEVTAENISYHLSLLLHSYSHRSTMKRSLRSIQKKLGDPGASMRVAKEIMNMIGYTHG